MSKRKVTALVCDLCEDQHIDYGTETLGLHLNRVMYHGPGGGGGLRDVWVCVECVNSKHLRDLVPLIFKEWDRELERLRS